MGIGPGSVLVWEERDGEFVVRRAGNCTSADIHAALFGDEPLRVSQSESVRNGIRKYMRR